MNYFIHDGTEQTGPYTLEQLKSKNISKDTLVWTDGFKDWIKAGDVEQLSSLFVSKPPPLRKKDPNEINKTGFSVNKLFTEKKYKGYLLGAITIIVLAIASLIYFNTRKDEKKEISSSSELSTTSTDSSNIKPEVTDTATKNIDTLTNTMVWDTISKPSNSDSSNISPSEFNIGGIPTDNSPNKVKPKEQEQKPKQVNKQIIKKNKDIALETIRPESSKINPVNFLSVNGRFYKNLLLEGVLEGTIQNRHREVSFSNIILEVRFLNAGGQVLDTRSFTQHNLVPAAQTVSFKIKTTTPKGTKNVSYNIAGARVR
jgi:hypothetical protein